MPSVGTELTTDQLLSALRWKVDQNDVAAEMRMFKIISDTEGG